MTINTIESASSIVLVKKYWFPNDRVRPYSVRKFKGEEEMKLPVYGNRDFSNVDVAKLNSDRGISPNEYGFIYVEESWWEIDGEYVSDKEILKELRQKFLS